MLLRYAKKHSLVALHKHSISQLRQISYNRVLYDKDGHKGHPSNHDTAPKQSPLYTPLLGRQVLEEPILNKGSAFTREEREVFQLNHMLPYEQNDLAKQIDRATRQLFSRDDPVLQYSFLRSMRSQNQVLFYALLQSNLKRMLPIIYTPTVGDAIKGFSKLFRRPEGLFINYAHFKQGGIHYLRDALNDYSRISKTDVDLLVVTDSQSLLGIGDWGVGGICIAIGKSALYTCGGGIDPNRCLNIVLDVGTDNQELLDDPLYLGWPNKRIDGQEYDEFVDSFVSTAAHCFPDALIHFEDFGTANANRLLQKFRPKYSVFNDDIQGTGCTALAALLSALKVAGTELKDAKIILQGAGSAGLGVVNQIRDAMVQTEGLSKEEASNKFFLIDRYGLIVEGQDNIRDGQREFARSKKEVESWTSTKGGGHYSLYDTVKAIRPTVLIGTSTVPKSFTEEVIREMSSHVDRPIILPLSNPTSLCEVEPAHATEWSDGRALIATGSPFPPVTHPKTGKKMIIAELNNALVFPALGLATVLSKATRLTDSMIVAGVEALSNLSPSLKDPDAGLLPDLEDVHRISVVIAAAVMRQARKEGQAKAEFPETDLEAFVESKMWRAAYRQLRHVQTVSS